MATRSGNMMMIHQYALMLLRRRTASPIRPHPVRPAGALPLQPARRDPPPGWVCYHVPRASAAASIQMQPTAGASQLPTSHSACKVGKVVCQPSALAAEAGGGWSGAPGSRAGMQALSGRGVRAQGSNAHPRDFLNVFCLGKREPEIPGLPPPAKSAKPGSPQVLPATSSNLRHPHRMHSILQSAPPSLRGPASAAAVAAAAPSSVPCAAGCWFILCVAVVIARMPVVDLLSDCSRAMFKSASCA